MRDPEVERIARKARKRERERVRDSEAETGADRELTAAELDAVAAAGTDNNRSNQ